MSLTPEVSLSASESLISPPPTTCESRVLLLSPSHFQKLKIFCGFLSSSSGFAPHCPNGPIALAASFHMDVSAPNCESLNLLAFLPNPHVDDDFFCFGSHSDPFQTLISRHPRNVRPSLPFPSFFASFSRRVSPRLTSSLFSPSGPTVYTTTPPPISELTSSCVSTSSRSRPLLQTQS